MEAVNIAVTDILTTLVEVIANIVYACMNAFATGMVGAFTILVNAVTAIPGSLFTLMQQAMSAVPQALVGFGTWVYNTLTSAFGNLGNALGGFGTWLYNTVVTALGNLTNTVGGIGTELFNMLYNAVASIGNSIHNLSVSVLGVNVSPFSAFPSIALKPMAEGGVSTRARWPSSQAKQARRRSFRWAGVAQGSWEEATCTSIIMVRSSVTRRSRRASGRAQRTS